MGEPHENLEIVRQSAFCVMRVREMGGLHTSDSEKRQCCLELYRILQLHHPDFVESGVRIFADIVREDNLQSDFMKSNFPFHFYLHCLMGNDLSLAASLQAVKWSLPRCQHE